MNLTQLWDNSWFMMNTLSIDYYSGLFLMYCNFMFRLTTLTCCDSMLGFNLLVEAMNH